MERIRGRVGAGAVIGARLSGSGCIGAKLDKGGGSPYTGPYDFIPSMELQTASTAGKSLSQDITVQPIPSNYGLITYNGSFIMVS